MTNDLNSLVVDVRANTQGFATDIQQLRSSFDSIVVGGFSKAGSTLETGLVSAIKRGTLGFGDLRSTALSVINDITGQAVRSGLGSFGLGGGGGSGGGGSLLGLVGAVSSLFGLPGRATGGPVSPGRGFVVGENGPELFVPTSAGQVVPAGGGSTRNVNVSIKVMAPAGASAPESLARSSRQIAQSVRRALADY
ncbi:tail tape measure protein [Novosphingobium sp.]|uniref:tail tape measure protein n=1 Tax=Novosphingobium sp. TaxID=1874826 RepID=UPI0025F92C21|nr:tail tape measure protein [Novosphingobium sp.]